MSEVLLDEKKETTKHGWEVSQQKTSQIAISIPPYFLQSLTAQCSSFEDFSGELRVLTKSWSGGLDMFSLALVFSFSFSRSRPCPLS